ncbi:MAG: glutaminase A [Gammaproteobacteria bacterium]|nr:glutaminase A [Gammaproteobacteria bacterium]
MKYFFGWLYIVASVSIGCAFAKESVTSLALKENINALYLKYQNETGGKNADYIPELAKVNPAYFAIAIATPNGELIAAGDADVPFAIESISKIFVYGLALEDYDENWITEKVGLNATGFPFNSPIPLIQKADHLQNPLVNAGAIQVASFIKGKDNNEKWQRVFNLFKKLSDNKAFLGQAVYQSETATNLNNRVLTELLQLYDMTMGNGAEALDRYTKACSMMVTAKQLALMGATLANGGVHPLTHARIYSESHVNMIVAQMITNGLYEESGAWFTTVGLPTKNGVSGGLLAIIPQKMAIVVFSPPIDASGSSVRGKAVLKELSQQMFNARG